MTQFDLKGVLCFIVPVNLLTGPVKTQKRHTAKKSKKVYCRSLISTPPVSLNFRIKGIKDSLKNVMFSSLNPNLIIYILRSSIDYNVNVFSHEYKYGGFSRRWSLGSHYSSPHKSYTLTLTTPVSSFYLTSNLEASL